MRVAVIGAGLMGTGIAQVASETGCDVQLVARQQAALDRAMARIASNQRVMVEAGLLTDAAAGSARSRIVPTLDLAGAVRVADVVSENLPEQLPLKQRCFRDLDALAPAGSILTSNTSGLSITAIASETTARERIVGLHWLNPPHLMLPVEIVRGRDTSEETMRRTSDFARRLGRIPIRVERDVPGFLWNRLQSALMREALHIVEEGIARPEDVDLSVQWGLGLRWTAVGPFRVMDLAGLGTFQAVLANVYPHLSAAQAPGPLLADAIARGHGGAADGHGVYTYTDATGEALVQGRDRRLMALRRALGTPPTG